MVRDDIPTTPFDTSDDDAEDMPLPHTTTATTPAPFDWSRPMILGLGIIVVVEGVIYRKSIDSALHRLIEWVATHPTLGILAVILVYILATVCFIPGSVLTIGTGYAFGKAFDSTFVAVSLSSLAVFVGASLGSLCCLLIGRYLFRAPVMRLAQQYPMMQAIDRGAYVAATNRSFVALTHPPYPPALEGNGFKIMLLLRLSPLIPFNALDYISGITSISIRDYSLALLGVLPGTVTFCYLGATASTVAEEGPLHTIILVLGVLFALAGAGVASYYSKVELDAILENNEQRTDLVGNAELV